MPSITAAIKQAAAEITMHRAGTGWILSALNPAREVRDRSPTLDFWTAQGRCGRARIRRALELLGVPFEEAWRYADLREGTYSKVVREVMRERARKAG